MLKFELPPLPEQVSKCKAIVDKSATDPLPRCKAALEKFAIPKEVDRVFMGLMPCASFSVSRYGC